MLRLFNGHGVEYVIIGAHALAFHGRPRFTKDFDVLVKPAQENAERIISALDDFGFGDVGLQLDDFTTEGKVIQLGFAPNRIDLATSIDGVTFLEAWQGRASGRYGSQETHYLGREDLIRNKRAAGRPQDLVDLETLGAK